MHTKTLPTYSIRILLHSQFCIHAVNAHKSVQTQSLATAQTVHMSMLMRKCASCRPCVDLGFWGDMFLRRACSSVPRFFLLAVLFGIFHWQRGQVTLSRANIMLLVSRGRMTELNYLAGLCKAAFNQRSQLIIPNLWPGKAKENICSTWNSYLSDWDSLHNYKFLSN